MPKTTTGQDITQAPGSVVPTVPVMNVGNNVGAYTPAVNLPSTITSNDLKAPPALNIPPAPADPSSSYASTLGSIDTLFKNTYAPTQTDANQAGVTTSLSQLYKALSDQGASVDGSGALDTSGALPGAQDKAAQQLGYKDYADLSNQLQDINNQIQAAQKEGLAISTYDANKDPALAGQGITKAGAQPLNAANAEKLRQNTIKSLGLSSIAQTLQGNVARAQDIAAKAVDAEFKPYQVKLDYLRNIYGLNKDQLSREDAQKATLLNAKLNAQQSALDQAKNDKTAALALVNAAVANNPGNKAAQMAAQQALSLDALSPNYLSQVMGLVGQYQQDPVAAQKAVDAHLLAQAQINEANINAAKSTKELQQMSSNGQILTQSGKPLTDTQAVSLGYANRVKQSSQIIDQLGAQFADPKYALVGLLPNVLQSPEYQQYDQAKRNFINANLRKESGANITQDEFDNANIQYFPQAGDSPEVQKQKKDNRDLVYQNLMMDAGNPTMPSSQPSQTSSPSIPKGTDGASYGHPGYVSDGTQWVLK